MSRLAAVVPTIDRLLGGLTPFAHVIDLVIRLFVASAFFKSGLTKIRSWDATLYLFANEYHVPLLPTQLAAFLGTFGELMLPPLLAFGLATRFAALGLTVMNIVAVISFWHVLSGNEAALASHEHWGLLLLVTLFHGPGKLSLDHWIWRRIRRS
ncbi:MAG: DoxX family protein [Burkholderiales bacterium]